MKNNIWNYTGYLSFVNENNRNDYTQKDWNQTLITSLNRISIEIEIRPIGLKIPVKFKSIFESIHLYNDNKILGHDKLYNLIDKYIVEFIDNEYNIIELRDKEHKLGELEIINFK